LHINQFLFSFHFVSFSSDPLIMNSLMSFLRQIALELRTFPYSSFSYFSFLSV
jgi:hypothetical protein